MGLKPDDWVVIGGLQQVRPRMKIQPEQGPMPSHAGNVPLVQAPPRPTLPANPPASSRAMLTTVERKPAANPLPARLDSRMPRAAAEPLKPLSPAR